MKFRLFEFSHETFLRISFSGQFYSFTVYMVCANSIVNPFVYAIQYHEFQQRIEELFVRKSDEGNNLTSEGTEATSVTTQKELPRLTL